MTAIEPVTDYDNPSPSELIQDSSPLSAVSSNSPNQPIIDLKLHRDTSLTDEGTRAIILPNNLALEERTRSISSDEFSELTELDSETETIKMYSNGTSQLAKLAKLAHGFTANGNQGGEDEGLSPIDNDLIQNEVKKQIEEELRSNVEEEKQKENGDLETSDKMSEIISEELRRASEEPSIEKNELLKSPSNKRRADEDEEEEEEEDKDSNNYQVELDNTKRPKIESSSPQITAAIELPKIETPSFSEHKEISDHEDTKELSKGNSDVPALTTTENVVVEDEQEVEGDHEESDNQEDEADDEVDPESTKMEAEKQEQIEVLKQAQRTEALEFLTEIEVDFAKLRDRLYEDRMSRFKSELEMCLNGSHPDLQAIYSRIDTYREEKIQLAKLNHKYRLEGLVRKTTATRTFVHQQFLRNKSDFKMKYLKDKTEQWYKINKERRLLDDVVPEYGYKRPEFTEDAIKQRLQINQEIQTLQGLNLYYGFPTAPHFKPLDKDELNHDLRAMNIQ